MEVVPLQPSHIPAAAGLFASAFIRLRQSVTALPDRLADPAPTAERLAELLARPHGLVALEGGRLAGYLAWYVVESFRGAPRRAAYVPVWGHAVQSEELSKQSAVSGALYHAAALRWHADGCQLYALTRLVDDPLLRTFWFWNGFGALVLDAVRPIAPLDLPAPTGLTIRQAAPADAPQVAALEAEHAQHYTSPPVLMFRGPPDGPEECAGLIAGPVSSVWLAFDGAQAVAYLRFAPADEDASELVAAPDTIVCNGAYTRPAWRGRGAAPALLDAALRHYQQAGFARCAVDFETINPEASAFWLRRFTPVCLSVMRAPENP